MFGSMRLITSAALAALRLDSVANRDESDMHIPQRFDFALGRDMVEIAEVRDVDPIVVEHKQRVARYVFFSVAVIGLDAGDEYPADFKLPGTVQDVLECL